MVRQSVSGVVDRGAAGQDDVLNRGCRARSRRVSRQDCVLIAAIADDNRRIVIKRPVRRAIDLDSRVVCVTSVVDPEKG